MKEAARTLLRYHLLGRYNDDATLTSTCSVAELVARHYGSGGYERLDLFVAYLAIQESEGAPTGGISLFEKLLAADDRIRTADRALLITLQQGPLSRAAVESAAAPVTQHLALAHSTARLAMALHAGESIVPVCPIVTRVVFRYDEHWFRTHGFTDDEVQRICAVQTEVYERIGVRQLSWSVLENARREMRQLLPHDVTLHGRGDLYQTLEPLLIRGQRPTRLRFEAYGLRALLRPSDSVLDIGCNAGFMALTAAGMVRTVTGIDAAPHFVAIGRIAQRLMQQENCTLENIKLEDFRPSEPFDVVFAFAVHHWVSMTIPEYSERLRELLKPGGSLLLESHDLATHDSDWNTKLSAFVDAGFRVERCGTLCDDGLLTRKHVLLRRVA